MHRIRFLRLMSVLSLPGAVFAAAPGRTRVVATTTDAASIVRAVGGDLVTVESLVEGIQDPHTLAPTPSLMLKARRAEVLFKIGLDLELWLEPLLEGARNPGILPGRPGHIDLSRGIRPLDLPVRLDRADGDVHPYGNPHIWLDPLNVRRMTRTVEEALSRIRPDESETFAGNREGFVRRLDEALFGRTLVEAAGGDRLADLLDSLAWERFLEQTVADGRGFGNLLGGWLGRMRPARGTAVVEYHGTFAYFAHRFGLPVAGQIEPKPGIPPTARHVHDLTGIMREGDVRIILSTVYYETEVPRRLAERTGARVLVLPTSVGGTEETTDYLTLMETMTHALSGAVMPEAPHE
ncbi:MAG: zinc ABC transporter substrate-binding protein [Planctomycetes bacterium]|nr:zinc ABC transporter substrate-binding protein [Planctomycetota bacterium]